MERLAYFTNQAPHRVDLWQRILWFFTKNHSPAHILKQWPETQPMAIRLSLPNLQKSAAKRYKCFSRLLRQCRTLQIRWIGGIDWETYFHPVEIRELLAHGLQPVSGRRAGQAAALMGFDYWLFGRELRLSQCTCLLLGSNCPLGQAWKERLMPLVGNLIEFNINQSIALQNAKADFIVHIAGHAPIDHLNVPIWHADPVIAGSWAQAPIWQPAVAATEMMARESYCLAECALSLQATPSERAEESAMLSALGWQVKLPDHGKDCDACAICAQEGPHE